MKRSIVVSAEVAEEIVEIEQLLRAVTDERPLLLAPREVVNQLPDRLLESLDTRVVIRARYGERWAKIAGIIQYAALILLTQPRQVWSGYPMLKHRLLAAVLRHTHIAYVRGLMFDPSVESGFSDRLRRGRLRLIIPKRIVSTFEADVILTTSPINRRYLLMRGVAAERIRLVGPIWLSDYPSHNPKGNATTYLFTSALARHGHLAAHTGLVDEYARAVGVLASRDTFPTLRIHPRDDYPYESDPRFSGCRFDRRPARDFLQELGPTDRVISPPSTLAFEAQTRGSKVHLFVPAAMPGSFDPICRSLGVPRLTLDEVLDSTDQDAPLPPVFSEVDTSGLADLRLGK